MQKNKGNRNRIRRDHARGWQSLSIKFDDSNDSGSPRPASLRFGSAVRGTFSSHHEDVRNPDYVKDAL